MSYQPTRTSTTHGRGASTRCYNRKPGTPISACSRKAGSMRPAICTRTIASIRIGSTAHAYRRNAGFRLDFLLLAPSLVSRLEAAEVDSAYRGREKPSDHAPVWVRLGEAASRDS